MFRMRQPRGVRCPRACWCKRHGLQATDAEDVSQEVFRAVLARIAQPQAAGGSEAHDRLQQVPTDKAILRRER
jgi:hypothetical protein